jgi:hypothetical protein
MVSEILGTVFPRTCVIVVMLRAILATYGWGYDCGTLGDCFSMRTYVNVVLLWGILATMDGDKVGVLLGTVFP